MRDNAWTLEVDLRDLELEFQGEEIKRAIWELGPDKALGLDGFPLFFYRVFGRR